MTRTHLLPDKRRLYLGLTIPTARPGAVEATQKNVTGGLAGDSEFWQPECYNSPTVSESGKGFHDNVFTV